MKQEITEKQFRDLIRRATGTDTRDMPQSTAVVLLEHALVKALLQKTEQRRELRRLNESVKYINSLILANLELESEVCALSALLDGDDEENSDTDPSELNSCCAHDLNLQRPEDNFPVNNVPSPTMEEAYKEWDLANRYPSLQPRKVG